MAIYYGNNVSTKYSGHTYTWKNLTEYTYTDNGSTVTVNIKVKFFLDASASSQLRFSKGNFYATLTINGTQEASFSNSPEYTIHGGLDNAWEVINFSKTYTKTSTPQIYTIHTLAEAKSPSTWKGTSNYSNDTAFIIPATTQNTPASFKTTQRVSSGTSNYVEGLVNYITKNNADTLEIQVVNMQMNHTTGWKDSFTYSYSTTGTLQSGDSHISGSASVSDLQYVGSKTEQVIAGQTKTFKKTTSAYNITLSARMTTQGTNYDGSVTITVPALSTMTVTTTNGNATYNGSAHYAKILVNVNGATIKYGTSSSSFTYTATDNSTSGTVYTLSSVSATNVADSKNVYYQVTKAGYVTVTGHTTITISKAANPMTYAAQSWSCNFSTSAQTKTLNAAASAQGTVTYSLQSQKQGSTTVNYFSFNTSTRVLTMAANTPVNTYTVVVRAATTGNNNYESKAIDSTVTITVGKATNPLAYTATQSYSKTFSTAAQTQATTAATGAQGTLSYAINSQKSGSTTVSYFSLSTTTLTVAADTPAGTYTVVIRATAAGNGNYNSGTKDSTVTFTINKATLTITPTAYNAIYNGAAHSASIKSNVASTTISYGTSTSYGNSVTAGTSNVAMSAVTRTNPGTTTVYYKATKTNYNDVTGSTTIKITGVPVHSNVSGTWKHGAVYLNINGTWKPATAGYVNVNGTWKSIDK